MTDAYPMLGESAAKLNGPLRNVASRPIGTKHNVVPQFHSVLAKR